MQHPSRLALKAMSLLLSQEPFKVFQSHRVNRVSFQSLQVINGSTKRKNSNFLNPSFSFTSFWSGFNKSTPMSLTIFPPLESKFQTTSQTCICPSLHMQDLYPVEENPAGFTHVLAAVKTGAGCQAPEPTCLCHEEPLGSSLQMPCSLPAVRLCWHIWQHTTAGCDGHVGSYELHGALH